MNKRLLHFVRFTSLAALLAVTAAPAANANAQPAQRATETHDQFFIISSVNLPKRQLVLKLPTEVTLQMKVTSKSKIVGDRGQSLKISDLRSGDTAYISYARTAVGAQAIKIRLGPMTVEELHKRYLNGYAVPIPPPPPPKAPAPSHHAKSSQGHIRS